MTNQTSLLTYKHVYWFAFTSMQRLWTSEWKVQGSNPNWVNVRYFIRWIKSTHRPKGVHELARKVGNPISNSFGPNQLHNELHNICPWICVPIVYITCWRLRSYYTADAVALEPCCSQALGDSALRLWRADSLTLHQLLNTALWFIQVSCILHQISKPIT